MSTDHSDCPISPPSSVPNEHTKTPMPIIPSTSHNVGMSADYSDRPISPTSLAPHEHTMPATPTNSPANEPNLAPSIGLDRPPVSLVHHMSRAEGPAAGSMQVGDHTQNYRIVEKFLSRRLVHFEIEYDIPEKRIVELLLKEVEKRDGNLGEAGRGASAALKIDTGAQWNDQMGVTAFENRIVAFVKGLVMGFVHHARNLATQHAEFCSAILTYISTTIRKRPITFCICGIISGLSFGLAVPFMVVDYYLDWALEREMLYYSNLFEAGRFKGFREKRRFLVNVG